MSEIYAVGRFEIVSDKHRKSEGEIRLPQRATQDSAGYDFYSPYDIFIRPKESAIVFTDVKVDLLPYFKLEVHIRSSLGKKKIRLLNTVGIVDKDYYNNESNDGNIGVLLYNDGDEPFFVAKGERFAQGIITRYYITYDDNPASLTRTGGFGSTDSKV